MADCNEIRLSCDVESGMGTSQSYSVTSVPLSHQHRARSKTTSPPSDNNKARTRKEEKGDAGGLYWKEEIVRGGLGVLGDSDQVRCDSVTPRCTPKSRPLPSTQVELGSFLSSQDSDGDRKPLETFKVGMFIELGFCFVLVLVIVSGFHLCLPSPVGLIGGEMVVL